MYKYRRLISVCRILVLTLWYENSENNDTGGSRRGRVTGIRTGIGLSRTVHAAIGRVYGAGTRHAHGPEL